MLSELEDESDVVDDMVSMRVEVDRMIGPSSEDSSHCLDLDFLWMSLLMDEMEMSSKCLGLVEAAGIGGGKGGGGGS